MIWRVSGPIEWKSEIEYLSDVLASFWGCGRSETLEFVVSELPSIWIRSDGRAVKIVFQNEFLFKVGQDFLAPELPTDLEFLDSESGFWPFFEGSKQLRPFDESTSDAIVVQSPVLSLIFVALTRIEELWFKKRDQHSNFSPESSILPMELLRVPIVDLWSDELARMIGLKSISRQMSFHPTFDLDYLQSVGTRSLWFDLRLIAGDLIKRRDLNLSLRRLACVLAGDAQLDPCLRAVEFILDLLDTNSVQGTFFMKVGSSDRRFDQPFALDKNVAIETISTIKSRGHRVGLHPSYKSAFDFEVLKAELELLKGYAHKRQFAIEPLISRQHYLRWSHSVWEHYERLGIQEDHSLMYNNFCGFRCGTARQYFAYDLFNRRPMKLMVFPPSIMDTAFYSRGDVHGVSFLLESKRLMDLSIAKRLPFTMILHNSNLVTELQRRVFSEIVSKARAATT